MGKEHIPTTLRSKSGYTPHPKFVCLEGNVTSVDNFVPVPPRSTADLWVWGFCKNGSVWAKCSMIADPHIHQLSENAGTSTDNSVQIVFSTDCIGCKRYCKPPLLKAAVMALDNSISKY